MPSVWHDATGFSRTSVPALLFLRTSTFLICGHMIQPLHFASFGCSFFRISVRHRWLPVFFILRNATDGISLNVLLSFGSLAIISKHSRRILGSLLRVGCHVHTKTDCGSFSESSFLSACRSSCFSFLTKDNFWKELFSKMTFSWIIHG